MAPAETVADTPAVSGESQPWPPRRDARYSLFVMTGVVLFTVLDRSVLSLLIDPIKTDFGISDTQAALLIGAAFSLPYGIVGLLVARLADHGNRRNLVALSIAFWSAATVACGLVQGFFSLLLARMGIGIGESGYGPASWSIATDNWPREKVAFATATMGLGATMGQGLALFLGGVALHYVAGMPPLALPGVGLIRPWQWAFILVGAPGLFWALLVLTTKEPPRRGLPSGERAPKMPLRVVGRWIRDDWRTYLGTIGGMCVQGLMTLGAVTWYPTMIHRQFGWDLSKVGLVSGSITLIVSPVALMTGAKLSERWTAGGRSDANPRIMFYCLSVAVPLQVITPMLPNPWLVIAGWATATFILLISFGPSIAGFQIVTPNNMRAQVGSLTQFSNNVIAFALSPIIIALFTDYLFRDEHALRYSMMLNAAIMGSLAMLVVGQGLKPYARSYERAVREFAN